MENEDDKGTLKGLYDKIDNQTKGQIAGISTEVGAGLALDAKTQWMLGAGPWGWLGYGVTNFIGAAGANIGAQKMRGEENIKRGEVISSGLLGIIPGTSLRFGKRVTNLVGEANTVKRAGTFGATQGLTDQVIQKGIDEKRLPTPSEAALGLGVGGVVGGGLKRVQLNPDESGKLRVMLGKVDPDDYERKLKQFWAGENVEFPVRVLDDVPQNVRSTMAWESGLVDGVFDFDRWLSKSLYGKRFRSRTTVAKMEAPYGTDVNFEAYRDNILLPQFTKEWGPILDKLKIPRSSLQAHHIFAIRASAGLYDGLKFGSKEWVDVTNTLLERYVRTGDMPGNIMPLVGSTSDVGTPHYITHRYIDDIAGPTGETFFTEKVRKEMKRNHKFRIKKTKEFAEKMKTAEGIAVQAQKVWDRIYGPGQVIPEELVEELSQLPMTVDAKYRTDARLEQLVKQVFSQIEEFPFPESMSRKEFIRNWLPQFEGKGFDALRKMFEVDQDLTPAEAMQTPLGYRLQKYLQNRVIRNPIKKKLKKLKKDKP